jgi:hypothetical protein
LCVTVAVLSGITRSDTPCRPIIKTQELPLLFYLASTLATLLKFSGAAVAVGGVGYFGFHFIAENGRSAQRGESAVPAKAWQGAGARKGLRIIGVGVLLLIASFLVALVLPDVPVA